MYRDRTDAGQKLAKALKPFAGKDTVVLALPRGGIVLGVEVADKLSVTLGLLLVRKIGHPAHEEYAIGALAEGEEPLYNEAETALIDEEWLKRAETAAWQLIERRRKLYYGDGVKPPSLKNQTVILVDDGIATGLTMEAAVRSVRAQKAKKIVVAVPVAAGNCVERLSKLADEVVVLEPPESFRGAVGAHYQMFEQVDDEEVKTLLRQSRHGSKPA